MAKWNLDGLEEKNRRQSHYIIALALFAIIGWLV